MLVSVVIPTVDRRASLIQAVEGCLNQTVPATDREILVIDNSAAGAQSWICERFASAIRYVHEPSSGLANARNRGIQEAKGRFVVFLDDDERPVDAQWLQTLISVAEAAGADATFGPVLPEFETPPVIHSAFAAELYTRNHDLESGARLDPKSYKLGTGNSCFLARSCFAGSEPFDRRYDQAGGEDVELLARLGAKGLVFAWAANAPVLELVPSSRLDPKYFARRRFRQGQLRTSLQLASGPRWDRVLFWMAAGTAQASYHGSMAMLSLLAGQREKAQEHRIKAWGGLGKIFWPSRFNRLGYSAAPSPRP